MYIQIGFNTHIPIHIQCFYDYQHLDGQRLLLRQSSNQQVAKLAKSSSYYYFSDKSFFCFLHYHGDSSTIPIAFIVKFCPTSIQMISDTMKEESLNNYKDLISSVFINRAAWNYLCICVLETWKLKRRKYLLYWNHKHSNNVCEQIQSYNN